MVSGIKGGSGISIRALETTGAGATSFLLTLPRHDTEAPARPYWTLLFDCPIDLAQLEAYLPQCPQYLPKTDVFLASTDLDVTFRHAIKKEDTSKDERRSFDVDNYTERYVKAFGPNDLKIVAGRPFLAARPVLRLPVLDALREQMDNLDAICISNVDAMMGLPLLTERCAFKGRIFAPAVVIDMARDNRQRLSAFAAENAQKRNPIEKEGWYPLFDQEELNACLAKVTPLKYLETVFLDNLVRITPASAGYAIGSCQWVVQYGTHKLVFLSDINLAEDRHPEALDMTALCQADIVAYGGTFADPTAQEDHLVTETICRKTGRTSMCLFSGALQSAHQKSLVDAVRQYSNVILPTYTDGRALDLLNQVGRALSDHGLERIPIYLLSPDGKFVLQYADINSEWLSRERQDNVLASLPPFEHVDMMEKGQLRPFPTVENAFAREYVEPCVIIGGDPSLRFGPICDVIMEWACAVDQREYNKMHAAPRHHVILSVGTTLFLSNHFMHSTLNTRTEPSLDATKLMQVFPQNFYQVEHLPLQSTVTSAQLLDLLVGANCQHLYVSSSMRPALSQKIPFSITTIDTVLPAEVELIEKYAGFLDLSVLSRTKAPMVKKDALSIDHVFHCSLRSEQFDWIFGLPSTPTPSTIHVRNSIDEEKEADEKDSDDESDSLDDMGEQARNAQRIHLDIDDDAAREALLAQLFVQEVEPIEASIAV